MVSPESFVRDTQEKFTEYEAAGVREYWIIDPQLKSAQFFVLSPDGKFTPLEVLPSGIVESVAVEGFQVNMAWFSDENLPSLMSIVADWEK